MTIDYLLPNELGASVSERIRRARVEGVLSDDEWKKVTILQNEITSRAAQIEDVLRPLG